MRGERACRGHLLNLGRLRPIDESAADKLDDPGRDVRAAHIRGRGGRSGPDGRAAVGRRLQGQGQVSGNAERRALQRTDRIVVLPAGPGTLRVHKADLGIARAFIYVVSAHSAELVFAPLGNLTSSKVGQAAYLVAKEIVDSARQVVDRLEPDGIGGRRRRFFLLFRDDDGRMKADKAAASMPVGIVGSADGGRSFRNEFQMKRISGDKRNFAVNRDAEEQIV